MGYVFAQSLKTVGVDARAFTTQLHGLNYPEQADLMPHNIVSILKKADVIQYMHSMLFLHDKINLKKKRVFVFHGGTRYREHQDVLNEMFNPIVERTLIQTKDLWNDGAKDPVWVLPAVDVKTIQYHPETDNSKVVRIGHFATNPERKGSRKIYEVVLEVMKEFPKKVTYKTGNLVPWADNIQRMANCDIYIDQMEVGEWGVSALEASALGKVVISNFRSSQDYAKEFGYPSSIIPANTYDALHRILKNLLTDGVDKIAILKRVSRRWVERFHSYEALGDRLKRIYTGEM